MKTFNLVLKKYRLHPTRGAWIEGLDTVSKAAESLRCTPHGVHGLKAHHDLCGSEGNSELRPTRGAWIEEAYDADDIMLTSPVAAPHMGCMD